jgi:hypothetical protein
MKACGLLIVLSVLVAGCDDAAPTSPSNVPLVFTAQLSPANEVPAVSNAEAAASGAVQITMTVSRDSANAITAARATFAIQVAGLPASTTYVGAHIHTGVAGVNGGVVVNTTLSSGTVPQFVSGTASWIINDINVAPATAQAIIDNPSAFYFNIHSLTNPAGVARGQLRRTN